MIAPWHDQAACQHAHPDTFYPNTGEPTAPAKRICATCPVADECLQWALDNDERHGVWGGLSEQERRRLKRGRGNVTELRAVKPVPAGRPKPKPKRKPAKPKPRPDVDRRIWLYVLELACRVVGADLDEALAGRRINGAVQARQVAWHTLRGDGWTLTRLANAAGVDHSTVRYGIGCVDADPDLLAASDVVGDGQEEAA